MKKLIAPLYMLVVLLAVLAFCVIDHQDSSCIDHPLTFSASAADLVSNGFGLTSNCDKH